MKIGKLATITFAGLFGAALCNSPQLHAQESAAGQEMHDSGASAKEAARDMGSSVKHAYNATTDVVSDATLTTKVKSALLTNEATKMFSIKVDSDQGTVTLKGTVDSPDSAARVQTVVGSVTGVQAVRNHLTWPTSAR
jgi:hyperosmotically inducible protein